MFANDQVQQFIDNVMERYEQTSGFEPFGPFTLTVFRPEDSGSLKGWKIEKVKCPGRCVQPFEPSFYYGVSDFDRRLARLTVTASGDEDILEVRTVNVRQFSVLRLPELYSALRVDGNGLKLDFSNRSQTLYFEQEMSSYDWKVRIKRPGPCVF